MAIPPLVAAMHRWDRGLLAAGLVALVLAVAGILRAPGQEGGEGTWRRRILGLAAAGWLVFHVLAAIEVVRGFRHASAIGDLFTPSDFAGHAVPALEDAAAGWLLLLGCWAAASGVSTAVHRGRWQAIPVPFLIAAAASPALLTPAEPIPDYMPFRRPPQSMEVLGVALLVSMAVAGILSLVMSIRVARMAAGPEEAERARKSCLGVGLATCGLAVVAIHILGIHAVRYRAWVGPLLRTGLLADFYGGVLRSPEILIPLCLGLWAAALSWFRRPGRDGENAGDGERPGENPAA